MQDLVIAGAGIAGLTAALSFAQDGASVRIYERSARLDEVGAGLQLSPNVTRILARLDVLDRLIDQAVKPEAVVLRQASTLAEVASVPLGTAAERRWGAPYLVIHRADLQKALVEAALEAPGISLTLDSTVAAADASQGGIRVAIKSKGNSTTDRADLFVAADGVWSNSRAWVRSDASSRFTEKLAWRTTILADSEAGATFAAIGATSAVTAFMHSGFHLIAYPIRAGRAINLAAFTPGKALAKSWNGDADPSLLQTALRGAAPALAEMIDRSGPWQVWPIYTVDASLPWSRRGGIVLIGDAAHASTPFAAQGAAMSIEDAFTLAGAMTEGGLATLPAWESQRRERVRKVVRRGALNQFAWHASGPIALARNLFLKSRSPDALAADLDWLYGWTPPGWDDGRSL
ncbi:FAD-dependent monooxygenase [Corticibacterium sp. UT-5YL-CI-8]|nr:FAD-dependent monooxygenase [Tianweitania sp. UT-5YL-CI-8]